MTTSLLTVLGTLAGGGLVLIAGGLGILRLSPWRRSSRQEPTAASSPPGPAKEERWHWAAAGGSSLIALVVTHWPMAVPLTLLGVLGVRAMGAGQAKATIQRLEAIAAWTEMLRDTLAGAAGLTQALRSTAPIAPRPLRPQMTALAARLKAGVATVPALLLLAADIGDPAADTVVACLVMAASERAQRLGELLGALAESTRAEVAMRLSVEASRASARTATRMITAFSFALLGLMALFARSYLAPYRSLEGQMVLAVVGCTYGLGLWLMSVMVRLEAFPRLGVQAPT